MPEEAKIHFHATANGSRIFVEECGWGPLMVMMHGLGGTTNYFQPLIPSLAEDYTILRFDFTGSGFSTFRTPLTIPGFVEDLESILESRETKEIPILVGHSLGSIVAMHYASKHPVKALVLIGAGRSAAHIPAAVSYMSGLAVKARAGIAELRDSTVSNNVAPSSSDLARTIVRQMISSQSPEGYAATCEAICAKSHVDPEYSKIQCPTVLIAGDQDKISPISKSEDLKKLIGGDANNVEIRMVRSGHQQVLEDTPGVLEAIEGLLESPRC